MQLDPRWQGPVAFHEMLFGTWLSYIVLVLIWEKVLKSALREWQYALLTCLGSSFFLINHYLNYAPFYYWLINSYSLVFFFVWYWLGMRQCNRSVIWKCSALVLAIAYTLLFIGFELLARHAVDQGVHEFWILVAAYIGFAGVILWRRDPNPF
ncbi:MAG: hypothetical protein QNJ46_29295 [Leptolyngbyaceae cyanobacterium MO_188.B28]|nr:hypothetical protein [Leptolyngbyaceae cyanobacterium MO_188.B28]